MTTEKFLDIHDMMRGVQVDIRADGKVLWVSVDGRTVLRISQILQLDLIDSRAKVKERE